MFSNIDINLFTTSNTTPTLWMPKFIGFGHPKKGGDNPPIPHRWYDECWEVTKVVKDKLPEGNSLDKTIYYKRKTFEDCFKKYNLVRNPRAGEYHDILSRWNSKVWIYEAQSGNEPIPLLWELEAKKPNILYDSEGEPSDFLIKFTTLSDKTLTDTPNTKAFFMAIKDYMKEVPVTGVAESLFGNSKYAVQAYQARNGWQVQPLYSEGKDWEIKIGTKDSKASTVIEGVQLSATFSGLWAEDITITFGNKHISQLDRTFQSIRRNNRFPLVVKVKYEDYVEKKYPHFNKKSSSGFIPVNFIQVFKACAITQESMDAIISNTDFRYCRNFVGAFSDLKDFNGDAATTINNAYVPTDKEPEGYISNIWYPNRHPMSDDYMFLNEHSDINKPLFCGSLFETFNESRIEVIKPIIDCTYMHDRMKEGNFTRTFGCSETYGVRPMREVKLRNIGNFRNLYFDGRGGMDNNTKHFSKGSIIYLINNLRDQSLFTGDTQDDHNRTKCLYNQCTLHIPQEWVTTVGEQDFKRLLRGELGANKSTDAKGWDIKVNDVKQTLN